MFPKGLYYRGIKGLNELFLVVIFASRNIQRLFLQDSLLACSDTVGILAENGSKNLYEHSTSCRVNCNQNWTRDLENATWGCVLTSHFALLQFTSGQIFSLLYFCTNFPWYFLNYGGWTNSCTKHESCSLWVSFRILQKSSNWELCGPRNNQNIRD